MSRELDDATVEATREQMIDALAKVGIPFDRDASSLQVSNAIVSLAHAALSALPDPRPTEAEVRATLDQQTPLALVTADDVLSALRGEGCFRPEPAAPLPLVESPSSNPTTEAFTRPVPAAEPADG